MSKKFGVFKAITHMLLPDGNKSEFEDGDGEEAELLQLTENDLEPD